MGFKAARAALVAALREGSFNHEARGSISEKNLLAVGDVEPEAVAGLVLRTRAIDYDESRHHWDESVTVHTFTPTVGGERWYIKAYFVEEDGPATFISVHRSE